MLGVQNICTAVACLLVLTCRVFKVMLLAMQVADNVFRCVSTAVADVA